MKLWLTFLLLFSATVTSFKTISSESLSWGYRLHRNYVTTVFITSLSHHHQNLFTLCVLHLIISPLIYHKHRCTNRQTDGRIDGYSLYHGPCKSQEKGWQRSYMCWASSLDLGYTRMNCCKAVLWAPRTGLRLLLNRTFHSVSSNSYVPQEIECIQWENPSHSILTRHIQEVWPSPYLISHTTLGTRLGWTDRHTDNRQACLIGRHVGLQWICQASHFTVLH